MLPLFKHALDSRLSGSPAYLQHLQSLFQADQQTGLIEIDVSSDRQIVLLYTQGQLAGAFRLFSAGGLALEPFELTRGWEKPEANIRLVNTPLTAVRLVRQAIEWLPQQDQRTLPGTELASYLHQLRQERRSGLLRLIGPEADGFLLLVDGQANLGESLFSTERGFENLPPFLRTALLGASLGVAAAVSPAMLEIHLHPLASGNLPYTLLQLRQAFSRWMEALLQGYRQQVGSAMLASLNQEINGLLELKNWHLTLREARFSDEHYFHQAGEMAFAYRWLLRLINECMSKILGVQQVERLFQDSFKTLTSDFQQALREQELNPLPRRSFERL